MSTAEQASGTAEAERAYLTQFCEDAGYLDHARVGPVPTAAVEAGSQAYVSLAAAGGGTVDALMVAEDQALRRAAALLGMRRDQVAFSPSTSAGLFQVAFALPRRTPGGRTPRVVVSAGEFPANLYPWWRAQQAALIGVDTLTPAPVTAEAVRPALAADTVAVVVSAVDYTTGYRADLTALREVAGEALLVVDAIQGLGVVEQDWSAADVIVAGGQKWLRSGWGTGVIACSDRAIERLEPLLAGWTGVVNPTVYDHLPHALAPGAARLSETNTSPVAQAALAAGLAVLDGVGLAWVASRTAQRVEEMLEVLDAAGASVASPRRRERRAGIVSFSVPGRSGQDVHAALAHHGVTCTRHGDRVRLAIHATTTAEALERVSAALGS